MLLGTHEQVAEQMRSQAVRGCRRRCRAGAAVADVVGVLRLLGE